MAYIRKEREREEEDAVQAEGQAPRGTQAPPMEWDSDGDEGVQLEDVVGTVLHYGSLLSMAIIVFGLVAVVLSAGATPGHEISLIPAVGSRQLYTPGGLIDRVRGGDATAVISIGLLVLILTPVLRVASTVVYFFLKRDLTYLGVTSFVLLVLIAGFLLGSTAG